MDQLKFFDREIKRTQERLCDLDDLRAALRTKSESGTTGCSDAGGGDTPSKPGRSADWQAKIDELWTVIEKDFVALDRLINGSLMDQIATYREMISRHYRLMGRLVEERRRSEERT